MPNSPNLKRFEFCMRVARVISGIELHIYCNGTRSPKRSSRGKTSSRMTGISCT